MDIQVRPANAELRHDRHSQPPYASCHDAVERASAFRGKLRRSAFAAIDGVPYGVWRGADLLFGGCKP